MRSQRLADTDWKYLRISVCAASTLNWVSSTWASILRRGQGEMYQTRIFITKGQWPSKNIPITFIIVIHMKQCYVFQVNQEGKPLWPACHTCHTLWPSITLHHSASPLHHLLLLLHHVGQLLKDGAQLHDGRLDVLHGVCPTLNVGGLKRHTTTSLQSLQSPRTSVPKLGYLPCKAVFLSNKHTQLEIECLKGYGTVKIWEPLAQDITNAHVTTMDTSELLAYQPTCSFTSCIC